MPIAAIVAQISWDQSPTFRLDFNLALHIETHNNNHYEEQNSMLTSM